MEAVTNQNYQELRSRIRSAMMELRREHGLTQEAFGKRVGGWSRFTVMRLESGATQLTPEQAAEIAEHLRDSRLVELVDARERLAESRRGAPARDLGITRMLERPGIHRLEVCLIDDLDLRAMLNGLTAIGEADIVVVVPTHGREHELFAGQPLIGHLKQQLQRLNEISPRPASMTIYESRRIVHPAIVVDRPTGSECATWPLLPANDSVGGEDLPITTSADPAIVDSIRAHIRWTIEGKDDTDLVARPVYTNDTIGEIEPAAPGETKPRAIRFIGYVAHGNEELDADNPAIGNLVSLLVLYGVMPREGRPPRRRILLYERRNVKYDTGRWSLLSAHVEDADIRRAADGGKHQDHPLWRGYLGPYEATARDSTLLESSDFIVGVDPFKYAAAREVAARFGLESTDAVVGRLTELEVPGQAAVIEKLTDGSAHKRRPIFPRVFALELHGPSGPEVNELKLVYESSIRINAFGLDDLRNADDDEFNDFIVNASRDGWLIDELQERLRIADR